MLDLFWYIAIMGSGSRSAFGNIVWAFCLLAPLITSVFGVLSSVGWGFVS